LKKTLILLFILVFPSALYIYLVAGKEKSFIRLEYFGPKKPIHLNINGKDKIDTAFYQVPAFSFNNQSGKKVSSSFFNGQVWVAYFAHLQNDKEANPMAVLMDRVEERTDLDSALKLVTFDCDSESVKGLQDYIAKVHAGKKRFFFTGSPSEINQLAIEGFYKPVDSAYTDGYKQFFLIDKEKHIRGIYNGYRIKDIDKLIDDISILEAAYFVQHEIEQEKEGKGQDHDAI
jgi:protein SCO1/2